MEWATMKENNPKQLCLHGASVTNIHFKAGLNARLINKIAPWNLTSVYFFRTELDFATFLNN